MLRNILPTAGGGGHLRRLYNLRSAIYHNYIKNPEARLKPPVPLWDFRREDDRADALAVGEEDRGGWRISDDGVFGGFSRGGMRLIRSKRDEENEHEELSKEEDGFMPFIRWQGHISTKLPPKKSRVVRSGFCSLRSPEFSWGGPKLRYNALELLCRTDGRLYTVNLKVSSFFPEDLYQGFFQTEGGGWVTLVLPFEDFVLTHGGRMREIQRRLDMAVVVEHIGFTLADGVDGDFEMDLARIRAVNYYDGEIID